MKKEREEKEKQQQVQNYGADDNYLTGRNVPL
jgi:hypothetical protein